MEKFPGKLIVRCVGVLFIGYAIVCMVLFFAKVNAQGVRGIDWLESRWDLRLWICFLVLGFWLAFEWRDREP